MRGDAGYPVRVAFTKQGKVRFISHRDVARAFERAFRIEALPLSFTQGFSPRPKVSFGLALSVGHESDAEYLDVELATPIPLAPMPARLSRALPEGIDVVAVEPLADRAPALQEAVGAVEWEIELLPADATADASPEAIVRAVDAVLAAETLPLERTRKGKITTDDIRPAIRRIRVLGPVHREPVTETVSAEHAVETVLGPVERGHEFISGTGTTGTGTLIGAELATRPTSLRPAELVAVLGPNLHEGRVRRIRQWIERDGERYDPLTVDARIATEARAS
jgi:radical SAM-linked protein